MAAWEISRRVRIPRLGIHTLLYWTGRTVIAECQGCTERWSPNLIEGGGVCD